ncbi:dihydroorotase [Nonomuraea turkmeniaca]|uniref:Dihydroorotase n=1 Tax=Nonomuraea turkmeniaca TaxID=103838 RepID=A0A5S4FKI9_9ACTN|nr:dihydroorotase [Nonomuraea turkmeniaca]TMR20731.1 dihydroorotase [Nonomuraea turkmeniaca]
MRSGLLLEGVRPLGGPRQRILIKEGRIAEVGEHVGDRAAVRVDCTDLVALPALVDLHTHLRQPGGEHAETVASGTRAAAAGGYGAVVAMANTDPVADSVAVVEEVAHAAAGAACAVLPAGAVTRGLGGEALADIRGMAASRAAVRVFSDDGRCVHHSALMRDALRQIAAVGGVLAQHAEDPLLTVGAQVNDGRIADLTRLPGWPAAAEESIIARDCVLAAHEGARLHVCHVSTAGAVEVLRWAKARGIAVTAEVTPHHLLLTDDLALTGDPLYKVNPPLRAPEDVAALRRALAEGIIDAVATDHAPHAAADKTPPWCGARPGMLGLETALAVVAETLVETEAMGWADVADRMAVRPAHIAGAGRRFGRPLQRGEPASLVLIQRLPWQVRPADSLSLSRNVPYSGRSFTHRPVLTMLDGRITHDHHGLLNGAGPT